MLSWRSNVASWNVVYSNVELTHKATRNAVYPIIELSNVAS